MRQLVVFLLVLGAALADAPARAQANAEATVYQGERPARRALIEAGMLDTTAVPSPVPASLVPARDSAGALVASSAPEPVARPPIDPTPLYYVIERNTALRASPDASAPLVARLGLRDGVRVLAESVGGPESDGWHLVRHGDTEGYVPAATVSNLWIRVDKSDRTLYVYQGSELLRMLPADVSAGTGDKVRRSNLGETEHYRIPEGTFFVVGLNDASSYYKAFVINYPNTAHAERGLRDGIITRPQFDVIAAAERDGVAPPMGTRLGGLIEIHGSGSGRQRAWTRGCVALRNIHMDDLWDLVHVGTPVVIEP